jgi:hypothetical protein
MSTINFKFCLPYVINCCVYVLLVSHYMTVGDLKIDIYSVKKSIVNDDCIIDLAMVLSTCLLSYVVK